MVAVPAINRWGGWAAAVAGLVVGENTTQPNQHPGEKPAASHQGARLLL